MLHGYLSSRRKRVAKFFWDDLLPIVKSFYTSLWNQERPAVRGSSCAVALLELTCSHSLLIAGLFHHSCCQLL